MSKQLKQRLQRLDGLFITSHTFDPTKGGFELISDVPLFTNDGWFLRVSDANVRSWYQIQGKAYSRTPRHGRNAEQEQQALVRHFKWVLQRRNDEETDVGAEVVQYLTRMWRRMPRNKQLPKEVANFIDTHAQLQHGKKMAHDFRRYRLRTRNHSRPLASAD